jgi:outer membrane immunogenic protein
METNMKKYLFATAAFAILGTASASAADLAARPYTKAPAMAPVAIYNWTGLYIGGHIGGDWNGNSTFGNSNGRFIGGVQGGADWQFGGNWVFGIEANYSWKDSGNGGYAFVGPGGAAGLVTNSSNNRGIGSATARLGYAWGPTLLYVKGGYGFRDSNNTVVTVAGAPVAFTYDRRQDGYTVGAGLEYMFTQNWSGKVEYQYFDFGNSQFTAGPAALTGLGSFRSDEHTVKAGLNYRFNWGNFGTGVF